MLKNLEPRLYQETILATAAGKNTLVVLPTGMGKTAIFLMLAAHRLQNFPKSKVLFLAPTKPLCEQHAKTINHHLEVEDGSVCVFTGEIPPGKRVELWQQSKVVVSTPQGLENDIISNSIPLEDVSLLCFDEAHRAVGDYSYVFIAKKYFNTAKFPKILGLTASPGSEQEKIDEVCKNLYIEAVEIRSPNDPDIAPYIQPIEVEWVKVELSNELKHVQKLLRECINQKLQQLKQYGLAKNINLWSKKDLLLMQKELHSRMASGERDFNTLKSISVVAEAIKAQHAVELLETQCLAALIQYFEKIYQELSSTKSKAVKNLTADQNFKAAYVLARKYFEQGMEHPKLAQLADIVKEEAAKNRLVKIILFTQYRDSAVRIKKELSGIKGFLPEIFVGQAKKGETGMSQKRQVEMLEQFRDGLFNVLISTSVGEEGLDIPKVDIVIFYEPIPSAIRAIQRRGRTGRQEKGRVMILMTKGTRDEGFQWSSHYKEKRMQRVIKGMQSMVMPLHPATLQKFEENTLRVIADYREKTSGILKELSEQGCDIKLDMLHSADYVLSSRVGIEVKTVEDFVASIIDGRLLEQLKELRRNYERPLVIIEGEQDVYSVRNVHPNAIRGMLATIAVSYGIPVLQTKSAKESAALVMAIAKREQLKESGDFQPHHEKRVMSLKESQEFVVSALPGVGLQLAKELLKQLKTVRNVVNASEEELKQVAGVGEKIAKGIKDVGEKEYAG